jgi:molybdopterin-guanine dinucleotide biosynthesis protein
VLDEETGVAVIENADDATLEQLFAGARACPTQAIIIEQFGRRVFPTILTPMFGESNEDADDER